MGFIGDWIIFFFKILISGLLTGSIGWQTAMKETAFDLRSYIMTGILSTMLVVAALHTDKSSQDLLLGVVIGGILVAVALISSRLIGELSQEVGMFTGIKLLFSASLGILVGAGRIVESIIAAIVGYLVLNHLDIGGKSESSGKDS